MDVNLVGYQSLLYRSEPRAIHPGDTPPPKQIRNVTLQAASALFRT
jgi:hypothetical protein